MLYLTQVSLGNILSKIYNKSEIIEDKIYKGYRFRPDFYIPEKKLVVEFDGYQHYTKSQILIKDLQKDKILENDNIRVVRIPYFIQLSTSVISHLFEIDFEYTQIFPHGFIDSKAILPADFCELGVDRFLDDLDKFSLARDDILLSLKDKIFDMKSSKCVITSKIQNKFSDIFIPLDEPE